MKRYLIFEYLIGSYEFEEAERHEPICYADTLTEAIEIICEQPYRYQYTPFYWFDCQEFRFCTVAEEIPFCTAVNERIKEAIDAMPKPEPQPSDGQSLLTDIVLRQRPNFFSVFNQLLEQNRPTGYPLPLNATEDEKRAAYLRSCRVL